MRFLLDQNAELSVAAELRRHGHAADHVEELGLATATDDEILAVAQRTGAVLVTLDLDFPALFATSMAPWPSFILLRDQGLTGEKVVE